MKHGHIKQLLHFHLTQHSKQQIKLCSDSWHEKGNCLYMIITVSSHSLVLLHALYIRLADWARKLKKKKMYQLKSTLCTRCFVKFSLYSFSCRQVQICSVMMSFSRMLFSSWAEGIKRETLCPAINKAPSKIPQPSAKILPDSDKLSPSLTHPTGSTTNPQHPGFEEPYKKWKDVVGGVFCTEGCWQPKSQHTQFTKTNTQVGLKFPWNSSERVIDTSRCSLLKQAAMEGLSQILICICSS